MGDDHRPGPDERERQPAAPPPEQPADAEPERDDEPVPDARYEPL